VAGSKRRKTALAFVAGAFVLLMGGLFLGIGVWCLWRDWRVNNVFREVRATVIGTRIDTHSDDGKQKYLPRVIFAYEVGGQEYRSPRYDTAKSSGSKSRAQEIIDRYEKGQIVTAYYDPEDPDMAVLARGYAIEGPGFATIGLTFMLPTTVALVWMIVLVLRARRRAVVTLSEALGS